MNKSHIKINYGRSTSTVVRLKKFKIQFSDKLYTFLGYPNTCRDTLEECCDFLKFRLAGIERAKKEGTFPKRRLTDSDREKL